MSILSADQRDFIERSTFLFVGSHARDGSYDVSPRGDEPRVLTLLPDGALLMPDRAGNNRIDTLRNILEWPRISLGLIVVGEARFLLLEGRAEISRDRDLLERYAVRGDLPASVMRIVPDSARIVQSEAFAAAGFWSTLDRSVAPLRLQAIIEAQMEYHRTSGVIPLTEAPATVAELSRAGLKDVYPPLERYVKGKAFGSFDPYSLEFLQSTRFAVLAFEGGLALLGGEEGFAQALDDRHLCIRSRCEPLVVEPAPGTPVGGLLGRPGRSEALRLNGTLVSCAVEQGVRNTVVRTEEIYFHCPNAFARSRIWRPKASLAWSGTRRFLCRERIEECDGVVSFVLVPDDDAPLPWFQPGQYVTVSAPDDATCPSPARCYSLSDAPGKDHFRITVGRQGDGAMSRWLHDRIYPGSRLLRLGAPRGRFMLDKNSPRTPVLIGAGVGLTPLVSMLAHLTHTAPGNPVWFIHGARNSAQHAMRRTIRTHGAGNVGLKTHFVYSRPGIYDRPGRDYDEAGRIDIQTLARLLDLDDADFYLCGPQAFMTSIKRSLEERGVPRSRIKLELFSAGESGAKVPVLRRVDGRLPMVTFTKSARRVEWNDAAGSLLALALDNGLNAPYICRSGDCQSCSLRLERGDVAYPEELDVLPPEGHVLMCQAAPVGDVDIEL